MRLGSGAFEGPYTFVSRFETGPGTNPEELIGAAHAGCFSMALAAALGRAGHTPTASGPTPRCTSARAKPGRPSRRSISTSKARSRASMQAAFQQFAEGAKSGCVVSRALAGVKTITLNAKLV